MGGRCQAMTKPNCSFTLEQRALIDASNSTYIEACPGAGKTHAVVQRYLERPCVTDERRGVALLSFTNTAVNEARSRCSGRPELLQVPNFVGTLDGFINRFITAPSYTADTGRSPTFRDTWSSVPGCSVCVSSIQGKYELDWFEFSLGGEAKLIPGRVPSHLRTKVQFLDARQLARITARALEIWQAKIGTGFLDSATSRLYMTHYLANDSVRRRIAYLIAARFSEVIVDEVQDCTATDIQLLDLIEYAGVRLICVGDPDQAIYGFRGASDSVLSERLARMGSNQRLSGNFRSTPAICSLVASLRQSSLVDIPVGGYSQELDPCHLVFYSEKNSQVRDKVADLLEELDVPPSDLVVLAHAASTARSCAGGPGAPRPTDNRLVRLALAVQSVQDEGKSSTDRATALRQVQNHLLEVLGGGFDELEYLKFHDMNDRVCREIALRLSLSMGDPFSGRPSQFKEELVTFIDCTPELGKISATLRIPNGNVWPSISPSCAHPFRYSTIHGFKGLQNHAVALVLPKRMTKGFDDGVSQWVEGRFGEPRRVLYVGASRAERLLILAVHESRRDEVLERLIGDRVPIAVHN